MTRDYVMFLVLWMLAGTSLIIRAAQVTELWSTRRTRILHLTD